MLRSVFSKSLWDQRRAIVGWSIGIAAVGVLYAVFYPVVNTPEMRQAMEAFPPGLLDAIGIVDMTSPAGYLGATSYGILGPILMIVFATALGSRAIAGEEESGRLEVLLAHPVGRAAVVVQRALAGLVALAIAGLVLLAAILAVAGFVDLAELGIERLAAATLQLVLLGAFFGSLALAVGAASGRRAWAIGMVALVAVVSYFGNTLGPSLELTAWLGDVSPFHYYSGGEPLRHGWQPLDATILALAATLLVALAALALRNRDVGV